MKKKIAILLLMLVVLLLPVLTNAGSILTERPATITRNQARLLKIAYREGRNIGFPETMQAILWQETIGGDYKKHRWGIIGNPEAPTGKKSYGACGVTVDATRHVFNVYPKVMYDFGFTEDCFDEQIIAALLTNDVFNIRIASIYFLIQYNLWEGEQYRWSLALLSYNRGRALVLRDGLKVDPQKYVPGVKSKVKYVAIPFNTGSFKNIRVSP